MFETTKHCLRKTKSLEEQKQNVHGNKNIVWKNKNLKYLEKS